MNLTNFSSILPKKRDNHSPRLIGETAGLSNEEWLQWRKHGKHYADPMHPKYIATTIGGSDVAAVMGISPWTSSVELANKKSGLDVKSGINENADAKNTGHIYEDYVALNFVLYMKEIQGVDVELWNDTNMYQHPTRNYALVNLDRRVKVFGRDGILECKTTSYAKNFKTVEKYWKKGICPPYYETQCRYYMAAMNLQYCFICCCWGFTLDDMAVVLIVRDYEIEDMLFNVLDSFVEDIELGNPTQSYDSEAEILENYYRYLYGTTEDSEPAIELPDTYQQKVLEMLDLEDKLTDAVAEVDKLKHRKLVLLNELRPVFGKSTYGTIRIDSKTIATIKLKIKKHCYSVDKEALKAAHPDVFDEYCTIEESLDMSKLKKEQPLLYQTLKASHPDVFDEYGVSKENFDTSKFKKKCPELHNKYIIKGEINTAKESENSYEVTLKEIPLS